MREHDGKRLLPSATVREAVFGDYSQISGLLSRYALETKACEEWRNLWSGNPAYEQLKTDWPIGWVLVTEDQKIVGYLGNIPIHHTYQGRELVAAVTHGWVVDSLYRSYALLLLDCYFGQQNADVYLSTTVNAQAANAFTAFKSSKVPVGAWDRSCFWIGHYRGFAASWAAMKALPPAQSFRYPLSMALWLQDRSARQAVDAVGEREDIEWCSSFDERFDTFWDALRKQNAQVLLSVRTREVLEWHFRHAMDRNKAWLLTLTKKRVLIGYCMFLRQDNPAYGLKRLRLIDFQTLDGDKAQLVPMLAQAIKRCREQAIHMLEYVGLCKETEAVVATLAPFNRKLPCWSYYYAVKSSKLAESLADPNAWNPSAFDGDSSL